VYPKLQVAISHWKPILSSSSKHDASSVLVHRLDLWVLPWIPHLDRPALLPTLLSDCKRKLKGGLSYLQRKLSNDDRDFLQATLDLLKPWQNVFDRKTLQRMVTDILPRMARFLSKQPIRISSSLSGSSEDQQTWDGLRILLEFHGRSFLTDVDFLSLMEAELLTSWGTFDKLGTTSLPVSMYAGTTR